MKFCTKCGNELLDDAVICPKCGNSVDYKNVNVNENLNTDQGKETSSLKTIALLFMIIATVISGLSIIPLAWMIPMTVYYYKSIKNKESVSTGFKVCTLIFVSLISGILMLCDQD